MMKTVEGTQIQGWLGPMPLATEHRAESLLALTSEGHELASDGRDEARDILLSAYWSAASQMLALEAAISRVTDPERRRALYRLYALETERREIARLSVEALWRERLAEETPSAAAA